MPESADQLDPRLSSARAKFGRAETQAKTLIEEMREACAGERPGVSQTSRRYDPSSERVLFVAEKVTPEIPEDWGLAIGEIVYNLRCALDHLWWALALDHLGREPTAREAPAIQFPILDQGHPEKWAGNRYIRHVAPAAAARARSLQGYDLGEDEETLLGVLRSLSNTDKHRRVEPTIFTSSHWSLPLGAVPCVDCQIPNNGAEPPIYESDVEFGDDRPVVGDVVLGVKVVPTGPAPDIDISPQILGDICFASEAPILLTLKQLGRLVKAIIIEFAPVLSSPSEAHD
jgi:hypothetical protein